MDGILADLRRLRDYASGLQQLMEELDRAAPERGEGADRTGTVRAVVGHIGLPESIRVNSPWKDRLTPGSFAAAVAEACQVAVANRGAEWSQQLEQSGWQQRMDRLAVGSGRAAALDADPVPAAFWRAAESIQPRPLDVLAEEAIRAFDAVTGPAARPRTMSPRGTGANHERTLAITLSPGGQVSCKADPRWVSQRTAAQLSEALAAALAAARRDLAAAREAGRAGGLANGADLQQLTTETLAALSMAASST